MLRPNNAFSNSFYVLLSNLTEKVVFFVLFAVMAREFDKEAYGFIISAFALGNIASSFFDFGFVFYFQREAAAGSREFFSRLYSAIIFRLICWVPFIVIVLVYSSSLNGSLVSLLLITSAAYLFGVNNDLSSVLNGRMEYKGSFLFLAKARFVMLIVFALLFFISGHSDFVLSAYLISALVHFSFLFRQIGLYPFWDRKFVFAQVKTMILLAFPMSLGFMANWIYDKVDVLVIGNLLDLETVAVYATAYSVFKLPQSVGNSIINPLYSSFSSDFAKSGRISINKYKSEILLLFLFSAVTLLVLYFFGELLITLIYSAKYASSGPLLQILAFGVPFLLMNNLTGVTLNAIRKDIQVTSVVAAAGLLNIVLNIYLLPVIGIIGAVYATIFTEALILFAQLVIILSLRKSKV